MSKHEKKDPKDEYQGDGHKPGVFPFKDSKGKHEKPDSDEKDEDDKDKEG